MPSWIRNLLKSGRERRPSRSYRPMLECLEARCLLDANVLQTNLVSDLPGAAMFQDPHLVNPWGISSAPKGPFWVSDNNAGVATLYNTAGMPQQLVVSIPAPGDPTGASGTPTGTVFNLALGSGAFKISDGTHTAPAVFLFATEDGTIVGWNPGVDPTGKFDGPNGASTHGVIVVDNSANPSAADGAVYKGMAIATDASGVTRLYVTNFRSGQVEVYDTN
ncbi:MAG TPA: TIGR03118 family protein, partial [Gemmataceae bacterium]|nr:TIGR03118 family protein [Gemmataceae bacterium]